MPVGIQADAGARPLPFCLPAGRTGHQAALLPRRLDRVAAAHAVRAIVQGIEGIRDVPGRRVGTRLARSPAVLPDSPRRRGRRRGLLGCRRLPRRHEVRRGRRRRGRGGRNEDTRRSGLLCRKAVVPGCRSDMRIDAPGPVLQCPAGPDMHDLDDAAAGGSGATGNGQQFTAVGRFGSIVLEAGENAILVVHARPESWDGAARRCRRESWWSIVDSQQCKTAAAIDASESDRADENTSPDVRNSRLRIVTTRSQEPRLAGFQGPHACRVPSATPAPDLCLGASRAVATP